MQPRRGRSPKPRVFVHRVPPVFPDVAVVRPAVVVVRVEVEVVVVVVVGDPVVVPSWVVAPWQGKCVQAVVLWWGSPVRVAVLCAVVGAPAPAVPLR